VRETYHVDFSRRIDARRLTTNVSITQETYDLVQLIARGDHVAGEEPRRVGDVYREILQRGLESMGYELDDPLWRRESPGRVIRS